MEIEIKIEIEREIDIEIEIKKIKKRRNITKIMVDSLLELHLK